MYCLLLHSALRMADWGLVFLVLVFLVLCTIRWVRCLSRRGTNWFMAIGRWLWGIRGSEAVDCLFSSSWEPGKCGFEGGDVGKASVSLRDIQLLMDEPDIRAVLIWRAYMRKHESQHLRLKGIEPTEFMKNFEITAKFRYFFDTVAGLKFAKCKLPNYPCIYHLFTSAMPESKVGSKFYHIGMSMGYVPNHGQNCRKIRSFFAACKTCDAPIIYFECTCGSRVMLDPPHEGVHSCMTTYRRARAKMLIDLIERSQYAPKGETQCPMCEIIIKNHRAKHHFKVCPRRRNWCEGHN